MTSAETTAVRPARLAWSADDLTDDVREKLLGPGCEFELDELDVGRTPLPVYRNRPRNIGEMLAGAVERDGGRPYLVFPERQLTYAELDELARRGATLLSTTYGIGPGDRVAIASANSLSYVVTFWAVGLAGAINVGLNGWWTGDELRYGIELTEPSLVLADDQRRARLADAGLDGREVHDLGSFLEEIAATPAAPLTAPGEDDPLLILFTSGTTGRPKGASLAHRHFIHHAMTTRLQTAIGLAAFGMTLDDLEPPTSICASPLFHVSGTFPLLMAPDSVTTLVFPPPGRWDERIHLQLTQDYRVTRWSGVPTQFWRLLQHPEFDRYDLSSLQSLGGGGATFAPELIRLMAEKLPNAVVGAGYGLSETAGMGASIGGALYQEHPTSVGAAQPTSEIEIRDPNGQICAEGEVGEICLRHAAVFHGYWNDPDATVAALDSDRWCRTGDFGRIEDGLLYLESRMRDMIIRGGENIYPIEIENRLVEHPAIDDAAVVGVDHQVLGQEVKACVVIEGGQKLGADEVQAWVAETMAAFKVPSHVEFLDELPRTASGKVIKHLL